MNYESIPNQQQQPPPPGYYQNPPPQAPYLQTLQVASPAASPFKYENAHNVFVVIFVLFGVYIGGESLITLAKLFIFQYITSVQLGGTFYMGLALDFGNGGLTLACGILIHFAVKSRQVPRLKLPLVLELIAAILMLISFGLFVSEIIGGRINFLFMLSGIIYIAEGVCFIVHIILVVMEIKE